MGPFGHQNVFGECFAYLAKALTLTSSMLMVDVKFRTEEQRVWFKVKTLEVYMKQTLQSMDDLNKEAKTAKDSLVVAKTNLEEIFCCKRVKNL